jgi:hypothetical protein
VDADYGNVPSLTFADALDAALLSGPHEPAQPTRETATFTTRHANPFLYSWKPPTPRRFTPGIGGSHVSFRSIPDGRALPGEPGAEQPPSGHAKAASPVAKTAQATASRASRTLTVAQQHAVDTLVDLGATLPPDFTLGELRSQFRRLARRLHPDRHPGGAPALKARLARQFADASASYQRLMVELR